MKVILFGTSGMVGQGVLRECLLDPQVDAVLAVGRGGVKQQNAKLSVLVQDNFFDYSASESKLKGYDACCFCLGVSSAGMSEADYRRITFDLTLAAAETLAHLNPAMTFMYVSGMGTDSSEKGRIMWARVKGETENALLDLPFKAAYMFRPGIIRPLHGIKCKTPLYNAFYVALDPLLWLVGKLVPNSMTTTEQLGRAMLHAARDGAPKSWLETADINRL